MQITSKIRRTFVYKICKSISKVNSTAAFRFGIKMWWNLVRERRSQRMNESKKNKHMLPEDRIEIQERLCKGMTFNAIARRIAGV